MHMNETNTVSDSSTYLMTTYQRDYTYKKKTTTLEQQQQYQWCNTTILHINQRKKIGFCARVIKNAMIAIEKNEVERLIDPIYNLWRASIKTSCQRSSSTTPHKHKFINILVVNRS